MRSEGVDAGPSTYKEVIRACVRKKNFTMCFALAEAIWSASGLEFARSLRKSSICVVSWSATLCSSLGRPTILGSALIVASAKTT